MRRRFIKGGDNKLIEIIEDDQNDQSNSQSAQKAKLRRYNVQLDKLSKATKDSIKNK